MRHQPITTRNRKIAEAEAAYIAARRANEAAYQAEPEIITASAAYELARQEYNRAITPALDRLAAADRAALAAKFRAQEEAEAEYQKSARS